MPAMATEPELRTPWHHRTFGWAWTSWEAVAESFARSPQGASHPLAALAARIGQSPLGTALHGARGVAGLWIANRPEWEFSQDVLSAAWLPATGKVRFEYHELPTVADRWTRDVEPQEAFGQLERVVRRLHWIVEYHGAGAGDSGEIPGC